jgi:hypothetical protein
MAYIYNLTDTWDSGLVTFNGIKINVTDTTSAVNSKLIDLQIGGNSKFTVDKFGNATSDGLIESKSIGFKFPDGTTQASAASINNISGISISGILNEDILQYDAGTFLWRNNPVVVDGGTFN